MGLNKVDAAAATLAEINPDTCVVGMNVNVCSVEGLEALKGGMKGVGGKGGVDLLVCCVDNFEARMSVN